jgi:hypothetical protein
VLIRGGREQDVSNHHRQYRLVAIRGGAEVFRQDFDDRDEAYRALADALVRFPDCEVRLISGDGVMISAGPAPAP